MFLQYHLIMYHHVSFQMKESPWPGGRVSNTEWIGWIGPGFDLHSRGYVVSLSKTHYFPIFSYVSLITGLFRGSDGPVPT